MREHIAESPAQAPEPRPVPRFGAEGTNVPYHSFPVYVLIGLCSQLSPRLLFVAF